MKISVPLALALFAFTPKFALADTGKVICEDELLSDGNTFGGLDNALKKINKDLSKAGLKTASPPVFLSPTQPVIVCVTITQ